MKGLPGVEGASRVSALRKTQRVSALRKTQRVSVRRGIRRVDVLGMTPLAVSIIGYSATLARC